MNLKQLEQFNPITIQCHDNPDADALASGFGLYCYFKDKGKDVRLVYSGVNQIQKSNLLLMIDKLDIPVVYLKDQDVPVKGLLITTDCQYGAGNVTHLSAENVAVIDHHQVEITGIPLTEIQSGLGSCSTLVWQMMKAEGYSFEGKDKLKTALYYGLLCDTNMFSDIAASEDTEMRDALSYDKGLITLFKNSNLSLRELEIAGRALLHHIYNEDFHYAIVRSAPCNPNILGMISDFMIQVEEIHICVVFAVLEEDIIFSLRSCIEEVHADELAALLAGEDGSGGGHLLKAAGRMKRTSIFRILDMEFTENYFNQKLEDYFEKLEKTHGKE